VSPYPISFVLSFFLSFLWTGYSLYFSPPSTHSVTLPPNSVKGKKYFECRDKHGLLVRAHKVDVGDYPEKDPFDELDDSSDDDLMTEL